MRSAIFEDLFVLELANNHLGKLQRGLHIVQTYGRLVRFNNVRAAMKLQFRDVDHFIHKDYRQRQDIRYIKKTIDTKLSWDDYATLCKAVRENGMVTMATPFDEFSVDKCVELGVQIIKLASSDIKDWVLIEKIATTKKPVIASTGGSSLRDMDDLVSFFNRRSIPFAINHCVSIYPSEDDELELNQIDFMVDRYPENVIGFSTHEQYDWRASVQMAYAKGARTFERHVDVDDDGIKVTPYNSLPAQVDEWFKAYAKAKEMCGSAGTSRRIVPQKEVRYLDALVRGIYAARDLPIGTILSEGDFYLAIPLLKGQISCRELMRGEVLLNDVKADRPIGISDIDSPYATDPSLRKLIEARGVDP